MTDAPHPGARARAEAICARIASGTPIKHAAALEGVPKRTWYDLVERDENVALMAAHAAAEASERRRIAFEGGGGSSHALMLMQTLDPECYPRPRERVETSGPDGGPQRVEHSGSLAITLEDAVRIARTKET